MTLRGNPSRSRHDALSAFSLVELVVAIVVVGILSAIAIPRLAKTADHTRQDALEANLHTLEEVFELYRAEHYGLGPYENADRSIASVGQMTVRLVGQSDSDGVIGKNKPFGPYLGAKRPVVNPMNGLYLIRLDGVAAGANAAGWRLDTSTGVIEPDHDPSGSADQATLQGQLETDVSDALAAANLSFGK